MSRHHKGIAPFCQDQAVSLQEILIPRACGGYLPVMDLYSIPVMVQRLAGVWAVWKACPTTLQIGSCKRVTYFLPTGGHA